MLVKQLVKEGGPSTLTFLDARSEQRRQHSNATDASSGIPSFFLEPRSLKQGNNNNSSIQGFFGIQSKSLDSQQFFSGAVASTTNEAPSYLMASLNKQV